MKHLLNENDHAQLNQRIAEAEKLTKTQIVLATVKRCDNYTEIPWKAFAFGASIAGLIVFLLDFFVFGWITNAIILFSIAVILSAGLLFVLLTILVSGFARLFLSHSRKETEVLQYAESLFLSRELFATKERRGILILVSQFERQVVILPDKGIRKFLSNDATKDIILKMAQYLKQNKARKAFETGLDELINVLSPAKMEGGTKNELSNEIIEEEGV